MLNNNKKLAHGRGDAPKSEADTIKMLLWTFVNINSFKNEAAKTGVLDATWKRVRVTHSSICTGHQVQLDTAT